MGNVVDINTNKPHMQGPVKCLSCKHTWQGVSLLGMYDSLECPECGLHKGEYTHNVCPPDGEATWVCSCGNDLFFVREDCIQCRLCGELTPLDEL
jgi:hypothetical protein